MAVISISMSGIISHSSRTRRSPRSTGLVHMIREAGAGGPVIDFRVSIYPSIAAGTEPAVAACHWCNIKPEGMQAKLPLGWSMEFQ